LFDLLVSAPPPGGSQAGNQEDVEKYSKRAVKVTRQHNEECKQLLRLMGVPVVEAPGEAEAQCAQLCKENLVYGISTEDMDSLTFGTPRLIRHLMAPASQKLDAMEFDHAKVLEELGLSRDEFIDVCILCGCDYTPKISGIGPTRALALIKKHGSIEKALESLDPSKYTIPEPFPYQEARQLFKEPDVLRGEAIPSIKWSAPDKGAQCICRPRHPCALLPICPSSCRMPFQPCTKLSMPSCSCVNDGCRHPPTNLHLLTQ
jgi:flap endonuclease-1